MHLNFFRLNLGREAGTEWARCPNENAPISRKGASLLVVKEGLEPSTPGL